MEELDPFQKLAFEKAMQYCAYRERAHSEVRAKLSRLGVEGDSAEAVIVRLIQDGFLNEQRFADIFARDKFHLKRWGRMRIIRQLEQLEVSSRCIEEAVAQIDEEEYREALDSVLERRSAKASGSEFERRGQMARYAINRGFEPDLVWTRIRSAF